MKKQSGKRLVEILAVELKEWPKEVVAYFQWASGEVFATSKGIPTGLGSGLWYVVDSSVKMAYGCPLYDTELELAVDHDTAIVTRYEWEAERAKLEGEKVMRAEPVEVKDAAPVSLPDGYGEVITATLGEVDGPLQWRDRITEIDRAVEALEEERASLIQKLSDEGFKLIKREAVELPKQDKPKDEVQSLLPEEWNVGDVLLACGNCGGFDFAGELVTILELVDGGGFEVATAYEPDYGWYFAADEVETDLRFHSRPAK